MACAARSGVGGPEWVGWREMVVPCPGPGQGVEEEAVLVLAWGYPARVWLGGGGYPCPGPAEGVGYPVLVLA